MAGGATDRAVRGLLWSIAVMVAAMASIPLLPPPPPPSSALPRNCLPTRLHYDMVILGRFVLFLCVICAVGLTFSVKVNAMMMASGAGGGLPKSERGGAGTTPGFLRAMMLTAVSFSTVGAGAAATAHTFLLQLQLGVVLCCISSSGLIYFAIVLSVYAAVSVYYSASLAMEAME